jgi:hypothetical protein
MDTWVVINAGWYQTPSAAAIFAATALNEAENHCFPMPLNERPLTAIAFPKPDCQDRPTKPPKAEALRGFATPIFEKSDPSV